MIDHVVVDVEIAKTIEEVGGWDNTEKMGISVACLWQYRDQRMRVYGPDDVVALRERLLTADRISGFNHFRFDFPVIWGMPKADWTTENSLVAQLAPKTDDLLRRIWQALRLDPDNFRGSTHGGWKLDTVAQATLGVGKTGNGADAPKWYQAGQIQRVVDYCCSDVAITRDLCSFIELFGYVLNGERKLEIPSWKDLN